MGPLTEASTPAPRFDPARRRAVVAALLLVTALAAFEGTVVSTAMPTIIGELHGLPLYSWVFSAYLLASTVTMPLFGRLADIHGRRRILLVAIGLFLAGAGACAAAQSMPQLILARALQGLGAGGLLPTALTVSGDLFSLEERAKVQGLFSAVWGVASLAGPVLGAGLTLAFGWRSIFSINLPLGVLAVALVATKMVETRARRAEPVDVAGALALGSSVTLLLLSVLQRAGGDTLPGWARAACLAAAVATFTGFAMAQRRREHPLVPPALFEHAQTLAPYAGGVLLGTTIYGVDTFVPLYVQGALGGTAMSAGAVVTPIVLFWAMSAALAARAIVRFGFSATARAGALFIVAGFVGLLAGVLAGAGVPWISAACGLVGCGLGPSSMSQVLAVQHLAPEKVRGVATSLVPFSRTLGGAAGVGLLGAVLAAGLTSRLGAAASSVASGHGDAALDAAGRAALGASLVPVFIALLILSVVNLWITASFPGRADATRPAAPAGAEAH